MPEKYSNEFTFHKEMYGLPDSEIIGEFGKPQEGILRHALEITKGQGNAIKKVLKRRLELLIQQIPTSNAFAIRCAFCKLFVKTPAAKP